MSVDREQIQDFADRVRRDGFESLADWLEAQAEECGEGDVDA